MKIFNCFVILLFTHYCSGQGVQKLSFKSGRVSFMKYSSDNKYMALGVKKKVRLFNSGSDTWIRNLTGKNGTFKAGHSKNITDIDFSEDDSTIATSSLDGMIKFWKIRSGDVAKTLDPNLGPLRTIRFIENLNSLVSITLSGTISLWDLRTDSLVYSKADFKGRLRAFDTSPDGKYLAIGGSESDIFLYDIASGSLLNRFSYHRDWIRSLVFSPNSKFIASAGDDKKVALWNIERGEIVKEFPQKGWVYDLEFTPDGKYLGVALERFTVNFYNINDGTISLKLNEFKSGVDKIAINPNGKEVATHEVLSSEIKLWNIESLQVTPSFKLKDYSDQSAPMLLVSNPSNLVDNHTTVYTDIIDLRGVVNDESGIRSLRINRIETPIKENGNFLINMPLAMGDNNITLEAADLNGNITLKKIVIVRKSKEGMAGYDPVKAKNYLIVIGINNYRFWPKLNNAVKDINDIAKVLVTKYNFEFDNITLLKDEQATRLNIYNSLIGLVERVTPQDNLVIYFSGHGHFDERLNEGYWIPVDANVKSSSEYISNTEVLRIIGSISAQHTFLVADACFSGALFTDTKRSYSDNVEKYKSRWALTSGRLETVIDGEPGTNSPFASKILDYLNTFDKDKFAISELIQFVKTQVAEIAEQTPIGNPLRIVGDEGGEMVIYKKIEK